MGRIRRAEVLRYLGYTNQTLDAQLERRIDESIVRCERELAPRSLWRVFDLEPSGPSSCVPRAYSVCDTSLLLEGDAVRERLGGARAVALFACTLGYAADRTLGALGATDPLGQVLYDAACTELVESEADAVEAQVALWAQERGMSAGSRFSPGYGDFDLNVQPKLLAVLNTERLLGLTCTDALLLTPTKSVTACVGLFDGQAGDSLVDLCSACSLSLNCQFKLRGITCKRCASM